MRLSSAVATAQRIQHVLSAEVTRSRDQRHLFRKLDGQGLLEHASTRQHFNLEMVALERDLQRSLREAARELGIANASLDEVTASSPEDGSTLRRILRDIRSLAEALSELDALNRTLAERTLAVVGTYVSMLVPLSTAYDRSGSRPRFTDSTTQSTRA